jgi:hypothetical protein
LPADHCNISFRSQSTSSSSHFGLRGPRECPYGHTTNGFSVRSRRS